MTGTFRVHPYGSQHSTPSLITESAGKCVLVKQSPRSGEWPLQARKGRVPLAGNGKQNWRLTAMLCLNVQFCCRTAAGTVGLGHAER